MVIRVASTAHKSSEIFAVRINVGTFPLLQSLALPLAVEAAKFPGIRIHDGAPCGRLAAAIPERLGLP